MQGRRFCARDLLRPQVLLDGHREVAAALDRGVVGDDDARPAGDAADAGDDAGRRRLAVVEAVGGQRRELEERRRRGRAGARSAPGRAACRGRGGARPRPRRRPEKPAPAPRSVGRPAPACARGCGHTRRSSCRAGTRSGAPPQPIGGTRRNNGVRPRCYTGVAAAALRRTIGSRTVKVAPFPGVDSTAIRPPCSSTSCLAIARPRPAPPESRLRASSAR